MSILTIVIIMVSIIILVFIISAMLPMSRMSPGDMFIWGIRLLFIIIVVLVSGISMIIGKLM